MKARKIFITSIIINILLICVVYNFVIKEYLNNEKIIVKAMTEAEYEDYLTSLNTSHEDYAKYVEESKKKIASALTEMGVQTSNQETLETMASNIRNIPVKNGRGKNYTKSRTSNTGAKEVYSISLNGVNTLEYYLFTFSTRDNHSIRLLIDGDIIVTKIPDRTDNNYASTYGSTSGSIDVTNNKSLSIEVFSTNGGTPAGDYSFELWFDIDRYTV